MRRSAGGTISLTAGQWINVNETAGANIANTAGQWISGNEQATRNMTDSAGQYKFTLKAGMVNADQQFYVTAAGLQSSTLRQTVNALVGLSASTRSVASGAPVTLSGHVTPSHSGEAILIEQLFGKRWSVIARSHLSHRSTYTVSHRFKQAGGKKLKSVLLADSRNARSASPTITVTVKP